MFDFQFDRKILFVIIGILLLAALIQFSANPGMLISLVVSAPAVLVAITFHEFAHAFVADRLGDDTARREGRLSLNPFSHLDPIGTLMLLVAGFGWGKPVHVDPRNYTRKMSMEKCEAIVSAAGPIMNIILAFIFALIYCAVYKFGTMQFLNSTVGTVIMLILGSIITTNIGLGVFNLIPLPPLDGSKIIMPFLPYKAKEWFTSNGNIFYIIFVVIWITGIAGIIISPAITAISNGILNLAKLIFGLGI